MRRLLFSLLACLPLAAVGQVALAAGTTAAGDVADNVASDAYLPSLWHAERAAPWRILDGSASGFSSDSMHQPMAIRGLAAGGFGSMSRSGGGVAYVFNPNWSAHANVSQQTWNAIPGACAGGANAGNDACVRPHAATRLVGSRVGATYHGDGYDVGLDVGNTQASSNNAFLPRVMPNSAVGATVGGLPLYSVQGGTSVRAHGRWDIGNGAGVEVGASVGRIRLLPGNMLGVDSVSQKALSLGIDKGSVSGHVVGRVTDPGENPALNGNAGGRDWTSVDVGVTWKVSDKGSLSFGAQNVWSSGDAPTVGGDPDQSSTPYVQYHQDF